MFLTSRLLWIDWLMVDMWLLGDLVDLERLRGLRDVRVVRAGVHLQLRDLLTTEAILGEHAPDGLLDGGAGVLVEHLAERGRGETAGVTRVAVGQLGHPLVARDGNLLRVDDDDEVTTVHVGGKRGLVLAAKQRRGLD